MAAPFVTLQSAWEWRERIGAFDRNQAVRVFHGPGEADGDLRSVAVDRFGDHCWVNEWQEEGGEGRESSRERIKNVLIEFLASKGARSAVALWRPKQGVPAVPEALFGDAPQDAFTVDEEGLRFWIRLRDSRHAGLFLDHLPLRRWLRSRAAGWKVLNTFAYTGSLSVACGAGGAAHVTTLDLSKPTVKWAEDNWTLNGLGADRARFVFGDVFEWLPRMKRDGQRFDCVILDPPSFSRGNKGSFSTAKDLARLHGMAFDLLEPNGIVATSINSANVPWPRFEADLSEAARLAGARFQVIARMDMPETFPTRLDAGSSRYLKGFILRKIR